MFYENYKILVKKYRFNSETDLDEVNYFSNAVKVLEGELDLTEYVVKSESVKLESNRLRVEDKSNVRSVRRMSSNIELQISDIDHSMREFFEVFNDSTYLIYVVELRRRSDNVIEWKGVLKQDSIDELIDDAKANNEIEIIKLTIAGFDVEFKEYFSNKKLRDVNIFWNSHTPGLTPGVVYKYFLGGGSYQFYNFESVQFFWLCEQIFGVGVRVEYSFYNYYVSRRGFLVRRPEQGDNNFVYIKCGFDRIKDTEETCWGWLEKTCNAKGWDFYFWDGYLKIENRYKEGTTSRTLSTNDFETYTIKKDKAEKSYKDIIIPDGELIITGEGGSDRKKYEGARVRYISNNRRYTDSNHFTSLKENNSTGTLWGHYYTRFYNSDADYYRLATVYYMIFTIFSDYKTLLNNGYLSISAGSTGNKMVAYNEKGGFNYLYEHGVSQPIGTEDDEFAYSGNYGNCLFRVENNKVITYNDECKTDIFYQNFAPLMYSKAIPNRLIGKYNYSISDYSKIDVVDGGEANGSYMIDKFRRDLNNESTELELIKLFDNAQRI